MPRYAPDDCDACPALVKSRFQIVEGRGKGGYVMFVGLAPGEDEDKEGKAFIGPSGRLLRLLSEAAGISPTGIYLGNSLRCHPPGNRRPNVTEIRNCRPFLVDEIKAVEPRIIVTLGDVALQSALGRAVTLGSVLGQVLTQPETGIPIIPTYHPAYLLRGQWAVSDMVIGHMEKARQIADGERAEPWLGEYQTAETIEQLRILRDYLLHPDTKEIAFDTETTGLDYKTEELLCISFATKPGEGFVVPILSHRKVEPLRVTIPLERVKALTEEGKKPRSTKEKAWCALVLELDNDPPEEALSCDQLMQGIVEETPNLKAIDAHWDDDDWPEVLEILHEIFASDIRKIGQNIIFDLRFLERDSDWPYITAATAFGFHIGGMLEDTMLLHHAIAEAAMPAEARRTKRHSLTILTGQYSDLPYYEEELNRVTMNKRRMAWAPDNILWQYSAADADAVMRVVGPLRAQAEKEGTLWASEQIIQPIIRCCWEMEKRGVLVDEPYFEKLCRHYRERIADAEERLWQIELPETEPPWKYLHSEKLQHVLFKELDLPTSGRKTDSGRGCEACDAGLCFEHESTGKDALAEIAALTDHPIIPILQELKTLRKLQGTNLDGGKGGFKRYIGLDGRIHCEYRPGGAETSRLASAGPNMQNVPNDVTVEELDD